MPKDPAKKYSVMTEMRKLFRGPTKGKMSGAGPRRDSKLAQAEAKGLNLKEKK